ncbi:MAG TPA: SpoIIE family protein phosphatase [Bryobacteraceae bacterium]|nr:SpoIIE family protein phosphatase [Bryobacteraceae bacterium]
MRVVRSSAWKRAVPWWAFCVKITFTASTVELCPGDRLIAYTHGITETMNAANEEYAEDRLIALLQACDSEPASAPAERLVADVDALTAGAPQYEDMTAVVVRVLPSLPETAG